MASRAHRDFAAVDGLAADLDRLEAIHRELRGTVGELRRLHAHLTSGHGSTLAELFDEVEAVVGAHLAKEARVMVPYLRGLAGGELLPAPFARLEQAIPILAEDRRVLRELAATLGARLAAISDACAACAVAYTTALTLASRLSGHRTFCADTLYPLALARERALTARP